jgi:hypothetical protein
MEDCDLLNATYPSVTIPTQQPIKQNSIVKINLDLTIELEKGDKSTYCRMAVISRNTIRLLLSWGKYSKERYPLIRTKQKYTEELMN